MRNLKKIFAVIMVVALMASMMVPALAAGTVNDEKAVKLNNIGLMSGMGLSDSSNRIQGLIFAIKAAGKQADVEALTDAEVAEILANVVDADEIPAWGVKYAAYAVKQGYTSGTDASIAPKVKFSALQPISATSFLTWLLRIGMGYSDVGTANAVSAAVEAKVLSLSDAITIGSKGELIRDDIAGILYGAAVNGVNKDGKTFIQSLIDAGFVSQEKAFENGFGTAPAPVAFGIESVKALNLKQIEVKFNKALDDDSAKDANNYEVKTSGNVDLTGANFELLSDDMTVVITLLDANRANQQEKIELIVEDVKDASGTELDKTSIKDVEFIDTTLPTAVSAEVVGNDTIKVKFSEPLLAASVTKSAFSVNDGKLYVKDVNIMNNGTEVNVQIYSKLTAGTVKITAKNTLTDAAGFSILNKTFEVPVVEDKEAPTIVGFKDAKPGEVTLIFNEDIELLDSAASKFYHTNTNNTIDSVTAQNGKELKLVFTTNNLPEGNAYIYLAKEVVGDLWDNKNVKLQYQVTVTVDETAPVLNKVEVKSETQIKLTFDENVTDVSKSDFTVLDSKGKEVSIKRATVSGKEVTIDFYSNLSGDYTIVVEGIEDESDNTIAKTTKTFTVKDLTAPRFTDFEATLYNAGSDGQKIKVNFKEKMAGEGKYSVLDLEKYKVGSYELAKLDCDVTIAFVGDGKSIEIVIPSTSDDADDGVDLTASDDITLARVADEAGNYTSDLSGTINVVASGNITITSVEAVDTKTIKVTFSDEVVKFDIDDLIVYEDTDNDGSYDANEELDYASVASLTTNSDGKSVATITLADAIDADATSNGHAVRLITAASVVTENSYGEKLQANTDFGSAVADKIVPSVKVVSDNAQVFSYDTNGNGKVDTVVLEYTEEIESSYMTKYTFSAGNISVTGVFVSDLTNALAAATDPSPDDGKFVVIKLDENDSDLKVDTSFTPTVEQELPIYDTGSENKLEAGTAYSVIDKAGPVIVGVALTEPGTANTNWDAIGDVLVLTFSEDVVLTVTDKTAPITLTEAEVQTLTGVATVDFGTGSVVTAVVSNDTVTLTISGAALSVGINDGGTVSGTAGNVIIKDKANPVNNMAAGSAKL